MSGHEIKISEYTELDSDVQESERSPGAKIDDSSCPLLVSGIPKGFEEFVEERLESKRYGGGNIISYELNVAKRTAKVVFQDKEGAV